MMHVQFLCWPLFHTQRHWRGHFFANSESDIVLFGLCCVNSECSSMRVTIINCLAALSLFPSESFSEYTVSHCPVCCVTVIGMPFLFDVFFSDQWNWMLPPLFLIYWFSCPCVTLSKVIISSILVLLGKHANCNFSFMLPTLPYLFFISFVKCLQSQFEFFLFRYI